MTRRVVVTGVSGTLGAALARTHRARGFEVVGVTHRAELAAPDCDRVVRCAQVDESDARDLLALDPDRLILCAGRIEREIGPAGVPLVEETRGILSLNALFPALVIGAVAERGASRPLDVVAIGSIADGSPSCFGPAYHASKTALHSFVTGAGPIVHAAHPNVRIRLYRPGVIRGPLSWAPVLRLDERAAALRARRCRNAPEPEVVAERIADWIEGDGWVGGDRAPLSFRALQLFHALAPDLYYRLQMLGWRRGSRFAGPASTRRRGEQRVWPEEAGGLFESSRGKAPVTSGAGGERT